MRSDPSANVYPEVWFDVFASGIAVEQTRTECDWIEGHLPRRPARILDAACGTGRHAKELSERGHTVLGIDRSVAAIEQSRRAAPRAEFRLADLSDPPEVGHGYDAVLSMWQSFGYGSAAQNEALFAWLAGRAAYDGVVLLDLYDPAFFQGDRLQPRRVERRGVRGWERKARSGERLSVRIELEGEAVPPIHFDWMLYDRYAIDRLAGRHGLKIRSRWRDCCVRDPSPGASARVQYVLERHGGRTDA